MPIETVFLLALIDGAAEQLLQHLEIDLALGESSGKNALSCATFSATMSATLRLRDRGAVIFSMEFST